MTVVTASSKPHDLYFFSDPREMMAGNVEPPRIFLHATAVLERQLLAYCMDRWIKDGVSETAVPNSLGACLGALARENAGKFPLNFLDYLRSRIGGILDDFLRMFPELDPGERDELAGFAAGAGPAESPMLARLMAAFQSQKDQRFALRESLKRLAAKIRELEAKPADSSFEDKIRELKSERGALGNLVKNINAKNLFNFLTEEGLLPNYAFPEQGVTLKAVISRNYRIEADGAENDAQNNSWKTERFVQEYNRPAFAAISEFAPGNTFYVAGHKLTIDRLDLESAQPAPWRLCPDCSHVRLEEGEQSQHCPRCGCRLWGDAGQVRDMLKVQMVYSNVNYNESLIEDDAESRRKTIFNTKILIEINEACNIVDSYSIKNNKFTFGYDYVRKAILREINFGETADNNQFLIYNGQEITCKGFKICRYCGKIQPDGGQPQHTLWCKAVKGSGVPPDQYEERVLLYREFPTEAIRVLVPATTMDPTDEVQQSFVAAFMLGMREQFGNVDHLRTTLARAPEPGTDFSRQYLVIYDSVPGGTGYLKQLMREATSLVKVLRKALAVLEACGCGNEPSDDSQGDSEGETGSGINGDYRGVAGRDGCYRCLLAYRLSRNISQISRSTAMSTLNLILSGGAPTKTAGLGEIEVDGLLGSELERLFVRALSQSGDDIGRASVSNELVRGKEGFRVVMGEEVWEMEPQVRLGPAEGVAIETVADFVLWPRRGGGDHRPVAVYTDGFRFHRDRVDDDTRKRAAILAAGKFRVWSLGWRDVKTDRQPDGSTPETLAPGNMPGGLAAFKKALRALKADLADQFFFSDPSRSLDLLVRYLKQPDAEDRFAKLAGAFAFSLLDFGACRDEAAFGEWRRQVEAIGEKTGGDWADCEFGSAFFGAFDPEGPSGGLSVYSGISSADARNPDASRLIRVLAVLEDREDRRGAGYEGAWNGFWHLSNVMQFSGRFLGVTRKGLEGSAYDGLWRMGPDNGEEAAETGLPNDWGVDGELISDPAVAAFIGKWRDRGIPAPDTVGLELAGDDGSVVGEAELAWESVKVALVLPGKPGEERAFAAQGWRVVSLGDELSPSWFDS